MAGSPNPFAPIALLVPDPDIGTIQMWQGSIATIPNYWTLCDGSQGTPDLRDQFVHGAQPALPPDTTGGAATHVHHSWTAGHMHRIERGAITAEPGPTGRLSSTDSDTLTTDPTANLPIYYALCFIQYQGK